MESLNKIKTELTKRGHFYLLLSFIAFNLFLVIFAIKVNDTYAVKGQLGFISLAVLLFLFRTKLKMSGFAFFVLLAGFALHSSHTLGNFYYSSPIPVPWDYVTHSVTFIGVSLLFFNFQKTRINNKKIFCFRNIFLFITLFLAAGGVGVLIELAEYTGYAVLGVEEGALLFGGGDFDKIAVSSDIITEMEMHGGGWYDSMEDLLINSYTSFLTLLILFIIYFYKHKNKKK